MKTPHEFYLENNGKIIDIDGQYGGQCWDLFAKFTMELCNKTFSCLWSGYVKDLWYHFSELGLNEYFEQITDRHKLQDGDWLIWDKNASKYCWITNYSHIAMFRTYNPDNSEQNIILTQNPNGNPNYVHQMICDFHGFVGALRPKIYIKTQVLAPNPVEPNEQVNQVLVKANDTIYCRLSPDNTIENKVDDNFVKKGYYNILNVANSNGYKWFEIEKNRWIAQIDGYVEYIEKTKIKPNFEEKEENSTIIPEIPKKPENEPKNGCTSLFSKVLQVVIEIIKKILERGK